MDKEDTSTGQVGGKWFIDLDWYQHSGRSFLPLAQASLCPKCRERLEGETAAADLLTAVKDCCSLAPDFITGELPVLESIFRLFLANGNQPLDLEELGSQLRGRRGGDAYRTSADMLFRLLSNDWYYGLRLVS